MWLTIRTSMISITKWNGGLIYRFTFKQSFPSGTSESGKKVIQDRTIYEDAHICAQPYSMGLMTNRDFRITSL
jgi:hypothetical protein